IIVRATIRMQRTESAYFVVDADRTADLDETLGLFTNGSDLNYDYSMAVPDLLSRDDRLGRATFSRGSLARVDQLPDKLKADPLKFDAPVLMTIPDIFPNGMVNRLTATAPGEARHRNGLNQGARRENQNHRQINSPHATTP